MDNFDLRKYLAEGKLFENTQNQISSRIVKLGKEAGISSDDIEEYVDGLESSFEPDAYKNITDKELLKDLKLAVKNLAEGRLYENDSNIKFLNKFNPSQDIIDSYNENSHLKKPLSSFSKYKKIQLMSNLATHFRTSQAKFDLNLSDEDRIKSSNVGIIEDWADDYYKDSDFFSYGKYVDKDYFDFYQTNKDLYDVEDKRKKVKFKPTNK